MELTDQIIFDTVCSHLHLQGRQAFRDGKCQYRGPGGTSCAVGCLLTDEEVPGNSVSVRSLAREGTLPRRLVPFLSLLDCLQQVHDSAGAPYGWPSALRETAKAFGLRTTTLDSLWSPTP